MKKENKYFISALIILILISAAGYLFFTLSSLKEKGFISEITGEVEILRETGQTLKLNFPGTILKDNDKIITKKKSSAILVLENGGLILTLGENSRISIDASLFKQDVGIKQESGELLVNFLKTINTRNYDITTKNSLTVSSRQLTGGSEFKINTKEGNTELSAIYGDLVINNNGTTQKIREFEKASLQDNTQILKNIKLTNEEYDQILEQKKEIIKSIESLVEKEILKDKNKISTVQKKLQATNKDVEKYIHALKTQKIKIEDLNLNTETKKKESVAKIILYLNEIEKQKTIIEKINKIRQWTKK